MPPRQQIVWALTGFLVVTVVCTYPIALEIGTAVQDLGDPLLNSWILAWETHSLINGEAGDFFDTNIFYPHRNTLAYSEFLIPQWLLALPLILASGNPVLAHNFVLLASLIATALATYLLAFRLTRSAAASFAAGLILAFCPFMFSHLAHLQVLSAAGIPLTFLLLFRWWDSQGTGDALLLALVYSLQVLANAYYAVYLTFFAGLWTLVQAFRRRSTLDRRFCLQALLVVAVVAVLVGPFYVRYWQLRQEMGFHRVLPPPTPPIAYLATPESNRLYGSWTAALGRPEAYLFPGIVASVLALVGLLQWARRAVPESTSRDGLPSSPGMARRWLLSGLDLLIAGAATTVLLIVLGESFDLRLGPLALQISSLRNPLLATTFLVAGRIVLVRRWPEAARPWGLPTSGWTFPAILVAAGVLSLGTAPYRLLYQWIPGFGSLRAVPRIHVLFMLALALLAAQGLALLLQRARPSRRPAIAALVSALILVEYFSAPLPLQSAPRREQFPPVHRWLAEQSDDLVYATYPLRIRDNLRNLYYSTRHWRRTVNGFSGFIPPVFQELADQGRLLPNRAALDDLRDLGVQLIVIDTTGFRDRQIRRLQATLAETEFCQPVTAFGETLVIRIAPPVEPAAEPPPASDIATLPSSAFTLESSAGSSDLHHLVDDDRRTYWQAPMRPDQWIRVDFPREQRVAGLTLDLSGTPRAYPRGLRVELSTTGSDWRPVVDDPEFRPAIRKFLTPMDFVVRLDWAPVTARFLRLTQTAESDHQAWTMVELGILAESP